MSPQVLCFTRSWVSLLPLTITMSSATAAQELASNHDSTAHNSPRGVAIVINTQGPGPFTFNINLSGASHEEITLTVNSLGNERRRGARPQPTTHSTGRTGREFLVSRRRSLSSDSRIIGVPETPQPSPTSNAQARESQAVQAPSSPQGSLEDCSDTEDDDTWVYHDQEAPAIFSPRCQLVTPSRKRKLDNMVPDPDSPLPQHFRRS
ncbi:hypothetical protein B0H15DRAFT_946062 [Mycena belliarum]|uniref:Uncharacterized protein n=1 Tax=Mycena belliarum TaxID=1033014 RepID=A0AAD6UAS6_9AGAR|nr:hypothetical protein B0H15DRAFT_946062 [Mycena belliae]